MIPRAGKLFFSRRLDSKYLPDTIEGIQETRRIAGSAEALAIPFCSTLQSFRFCFTMRGL
jgi:hypothetical protein